MIQEGRNASENAGSENGTDNWHQVTLINMLSSHYLEN